MLNNDLTMGILYSFRGAKACILRTVFTAEFSEEK
jgi:hypothetical protein